MRVIYFHGFASSPMSKKVDMLKAAGFTVSAPEIDVNPNIAELALVRFIQDEQERYGDSDKQCVFVGTSMGAYWAARMNLFFDVTTIMINPAMKPEIVLKKFVGEYLNYKTLEMGYLSDEDVNEYIKYPVTEDSARFRTYFIANKDTPVPETTSRVFQYNSDDHQALSFFDDVIHYLKLIASMPDRDPTDFPDFTSY